MGRGIYYDTGVMKHDLVIYQDHRDRWRLDLITGALGTHANVTGPNAGYGSAEAAFQAALDVQRVRGIRGKSHVWIKDRDGNLSDYEPMEANGRATTVDAVAARELDLYIANTYELVGAPNSIGKSIDANLKRKIANGSYDSALAPKAWQHLVDEGAKRYQLEFGSDSPIFNAATRRQVAADFAQAWEEESGMQPNARQISASMQPYADWSYEDFYQHALDDGQTKRDARWQATRDSYAVGRLDFLPPRNVPKGWTVSSSPIFRRRDAKPAFEAHKGNKYMVFGLDGKPLSPELFRLRGLLEWREQNGWISSR